MQSDGVSVSSVSLPLSLLVWEVLERGHVARLGQICLLRASTEPGHGEE